MKTEHAHSANADLYRYELNTKADEWVELEVEAPDDTPGNIVALVESADGNLEVEVDGGSGENRSRYQRAKLYLKNGARSITLRVRTSVATRVSAAVLFIRNEIQQLRETLPCRSCTALVGFLVSAVFAALGLPLFDVPETLEVPDIADPDAVLGGPPDLSPTDPGRLGLDPDGATMEIENDGVIAAFTPEQQQAIRDAANGEGPIGYLKETIDAIDFGLYARLVSTLEFFNWVFRVRNRVYKQVCAQAGLCPEE